MRILITGANGFLGRHLLHFLQSKNREVVATGKGPCRAIGNTYPYLEADLTNEVSVHQLVQQAQPDVIIHTAAMSKPDDCHFCRPACLQANVMATQYLLDAAKANSGDHTIHFIFTSTDFIFGENGPHAEDDPIQPLNFYGASKWMAEQCIYHARIPYTIVRPVFMYGPVWPGMRGSFIQWVKNSLEANKSIKVVADEARTPTYIEDICSAIYTIVATKKTGVYHLGGKDIVSPYTIALTTARVLGLGTYLIQQVNGAELQQPVVRARKSGVQIHKAIRELNYQPHALEAGIRLSFNLPVNARN